MSSETHIKAILFDMDGVLIDAREWHYEALNKALEVFGYGIDRYDHLVTYDGLPTKRKLELLSLEEGLPRPLHTFINQLKQRYTMDLVHTRCKPVFHHEYALSTLQGRGYRMAVCSNSIRATVESMMERSNLRPYLDLLLSNEDVRAAKPDPEIYLAAMSRLGYEPRECLIVEDNENGCQAALRSGGHLLRVKNPAEVTLERIEMSLMNLEAAVCC